MDNLGDYRPGLKAIAEPEVKSPLRHAELYKAEIRELSRAMNLPTADKSSFACLAFGFVYGEKINPEKLAMITRTEDLLREKGFKQFRIWIHYKLARIEILSEDFQKVLSVREEISARLKNFGSDSVSSDLQGYCVGNMNIA